MSVGGRVVETIDLPEQQRVWVNTEERASGERCAIYVERTDAARAVSPGDSLWWQGEHAYWTPVKAGRPFSDYQLTRIGGSGVARPEVAHD